VGAVRGDLGLERAPRCTFWRSNYVSIPINRYNLLLAIASLWVLLAAFAPAPWMGALPSWFDRLVVLFSLFGIHAGPRLLFCSAPPLGSCSGCRS
jgi:hypothetical protein